MHPRAGWQLKLIGCANSQLDIGLGFRDAGIDAADGVPAMPREVNGVGDVIDTRARVQN